jgi:RecA/RadA recombinase
MAVQVYGPESSGKTTLALHAMAAVQRAGGTALLVDAEHAFDAQYSKVTCQGCFKLSDGYLSCLMLSVSCLMVMVM